MFSLLNIPPPFQAGAFFGQQVHGGGMSSAFLSKLVVLVLQAMSDLYPDTHEM